MNVRMNFLIAALSCVTLGALTGCMDTDKDLYDGSYQTANPLGDGFTAPTGFSWSMLTSVDVTVKVDDEFSGRYTYLVEIFTENPTGEGNTAKPYAQGTAKQGADFKTTVTVANSVNTIYVRQTDPEGFVSVRTYTLDGTSLVCDFGAKVAATAKAMTRSVDKGHILDLSSSITIPADAVVLGSEHLDWGTAGKYYLGSEKHSAKDFIVNGTVLLSTKILTNTWSGTPDPKTIYVNGTLEIPFSGTFDCDDISFVVMPGGKIDFTNSGSTFYLKGHLYVMPGGTVTGENLTIDVAGDVYANFGVLNANKVIVNEGTFYNGTTTSVNEIKLANSGNSIENHGILTTNKIESQGDPTINNYCAIIVNGDYIVSGYSTINMKASTLFKAADFYSLGSVNLDDYAMFVVGKLRCGYELAITGNATDKALVLMDECAVTQPVFVSFTNLSVVTEDAIPSGLKLNNVNWAEAVNIVIPQDEDGCNGDGYQADKPHDGEDQTPSDNITINQTYTFAFEDQWPIYGDHDMNDLVITIDKVAMSLSAGQVTEATIEGRLRAVGATKKLGVGLQVLNLSNSAVSGVSLNGTDASFESGQSCPTVKLIDDAHKYLSGSTERTFVNTLAGKKAEVSAQSYTVTLTFATPVAQSALNINNLDLFIITDESGSTRTEVHTAYKQWTNKMNNTFAGNNNDDSYEKGYFISKDNLAWGLIVPGEFDYPNEYQMILTAYPSFGEWVESNGSLDSTWYQK